MMMYLIIICNSQINWYQFNKLYETLRKSQFQNYIPPRDCDRGKRGYKKCFITTVLIWPALSPYVFNVYSKSMHEHFAYNMWANRNKTRVPTCHPMLVNGLTLLNMQQNSLSNNLIMKLIHYHYRNISGDSLWEAGANVSLALTTMVINQGFSGKISFKTHQRCSLWENSKPSSPLLS